MATDNFYRWPIHHSGVLRTEFTSPFRALFGESDIYEKIVRALAKSRGGVPRTNLLTALKAEPGGSLNRKLGKLEEAGFIAPITPYDKRKKNALYRIIDPYVYFYPALNATEIFGAHP